MLRSWAAARTRQRESMAAAEIPLGADHPHLTCGACHKPLRSTSLHSLHSLHAAGCAAGCKAWIRSLEEQELQHAALARQHEQLQQQHAAGQAELAAARAGWQQQQTGRELLQLELASLKEERDVLLRSRVQPYIDAAAAAAEAALP
jgi:hypothetical protein